MGERIVVTGLGLVTPHGIGRDRVWPRLLEGDCATGPVRLFDAGPYGVDRGGEIPDFDPHPFLRRLDPRQVGRAAQLAIAASRLALEEADLAPESAPAERFGVAMGTTSGEAREVERFDDLVIAERLDEIGGELVTRYPSHRIPELVATELGLAGPNIMIPAACSAGNYAIAYALDTLRAGRADAMLAGGADCFSRITYAGFSRLGAVASDRCQPFDRNREGMIPSEGAGVLLLERESFARRRGAPILAELAGYGLSCDAHHMTAAHPRGEGAVRAMRDALGQARVEPREVDYVSAHGTGTPTNDRLETLAVRRVFAEDARRKPVSSIKSMIGHTMGAASAIEAAVCVLAVRQGRVPPTIHFEEPDPECELDCVPNEARELPVKVAMSNSYAFGGYNASVVVRQVAS